MEVTMECSSQAATMTEAEKQRAIETCKLLLLKEDYNQALAILQPMECIMATWMKGKICMIVADKFHECFKSNPTEDNKNGYRDVLATAYTHLYRAGCMMRKADYKIKDTLNPYIWKEINKVEDELAHLWPRKNNFMDVESDNDHSQMNANHQVNSIIDLIAFMSL